MTDFQEYLYAKRGIDDRALNRRVLDCLRSELTDPLQVVEIGAGVGTGITRLFDWGVLPENVSYTAIDRQPRNVAAAREHLLESGFTEDDDCLRREGATVSLVTEDALGIVDDEQYDLLVAQAVLDLLNLDSALPTLFDSLVPGGLAYFPITFDGGTIFEPEHPLDERIIDTYHHDMDHEGSSQTGRRLFSTIPETGGEIIAAGSSDWVVYPPYLPDEQVFLSHILDTIEGALAGGAVGDELEQWLAIRREQLANDELTYIAHQLDVLAQD
jgi:predicted O-methyltransferase YrrM